MKAIKPILPILPIVALLLLSGCRTVRVVEQVPVHVHDTLRLTQTLRDSIFIDHFREVTKKADTIYITDSIAVVKYSLKTDTAYRYIERPVTVSKTETVEVEKPLRWWQKGLMWAGALGIFIALAAVAVLTLRLHRH